MDKNKSIKTVLMTVGTSLFTIGMTVVTANPMEYKSYIPIVLGLVCVYLREMYKGDNSNE